MKDLDFLKYLLLPCYCVDKILPKTWWGCGVGDGWPTCMGGELSGEPGKETA